jgi:hypothetical protein
LLQVQIANCPVASPVPAAIPDSNEPEDSLPLPLDFLNGTLPIPLFPADPSLPGDNSTDSSETSPPSVGGVWFWLVLSASIGLCCGYHRVQLYRLARKALARPFFVACVAHLPWITRPVPSVSAPTHLPYLWRSNFAPDGADAPLRVWRPSNFTRIPVPEVAPSLDTIPEIFPEVDPEQVTPGAAVSRPSLSEGVSSVTPPTSPPPVEN